MPFAISKMGGLAVGSMKATISLDTHPSFNTSEMVQVIESGLRGVAGFASYQDGSQDLISIWFPKDLTSGKHRVSAHTHLLRVFVGGGAIKNYSLNGEVEIKAGGSDFLDASFDLEGGGITVKGEFNVKGIDPFLNAD